MTAPAAEANFDGIVGPSHTYAGLSPGNLASEAHGGRVSNPRAAALQGLAKMRLLADIGIAQGVLPPHERPDVHALRRLGFSGSDAQILSAAAREPALLRAVGSASAMWAANAATVSPSADTADARVHLTPANLPANFHRSLEAPTTSRILRKIFAEDSAFVHHEALPLGTHFADEGAANHTRLAPSHADPGLELFVYGRTAFEPHEPTSYRHPARQTREASAAVARLHAARDVLLARQAPAAIDAGAFHNDVVAVGNENVLLYHERAFADPAAVKDSKDSIARWFAARERPFHPLCISDHQLPLAEAVKTYLFNSQLVTLPNGTMTLIAPAECQSSKSTLQAIDHILASNTPIRYVRYVDVAESMDNGGGPACLRLRVVLTPAEQARVAPGIWLTPSLHAQLESWIIRHYRDRLTPSDLADPHFLTESRAALDELTQILGLGSIYPFQLT